MNLDNTLVNRSMRIWAGPRWIPSNEGPLRIISSFHMNTSTLLGQGQIHGKSQQGCLSPSDLRTQVSATKPVPVTRVSLGARTRFPLAWSNIGITVQKHARNADTMTNTHKSGSRELRLREHFQLDETFPLQNDPRSQSRRTTIPNAASIFQNRRRRRSVRTPMWAMA